MEKLILEVEKLYIEYGNSNETVRLSQELDKHIVREQRRKLKCIKKL